ncbi:MAG: class D sortase [Terracidiphilus sp.]|jgi:sortase A
MNERDKFVLRGQRFIRWTRWILMLSGVLAIAFAALTLFNARTFQSAAGQILDNQIHAAVLHPGIQVKKTVKEGDVLGRIEIPRIGMSVIVLQGTTPKTLRLGVGHIVGTALPGESGNIGIAGHRDTFFRGLKDVHRDDEILLQSADGISRYEVDWIQITAPGDGGIVSLAKDPGLTLVTCYPFHFIGSAPERYVVHAHMK